MDFYQILGVNSNATEEEIKKAHRMLTKKYHPDINSSEDALKKMSQINLAYDTLSNPDKRREYDKKTSKITRDDTTNFDNSSDISERRKDLDSLYQEFADIVVAIMKLQKDYITPSREHIQRLQLLSQKIKETRKSFIDAEDPVSLCFFLVEKLIDVEEKINYTYGDIFHIAMKELLLEEYNELKEKEKETSKNSDFKPKKNR